MFWFSSDSLSGLELNIHSDIMQAVNEIFFVVASAECTIWPMPVCVCICMSVMAEAPMFS